MNNSQNYEQPNPFFRRGTTIDFLFITFLWILSIIITNPLGNFPLNDDWSFGIAAKRFIEEGNFRPTGWTAMPLITQTLWGTLFCMPFGFSFEAVRFSTLLVSLLGTFSIYLMIRQMDHQRWLAIIVALTVSFNPIYFALSHTFMTDVFATAFTFIAILFFMHSIRSESDVHLIIGSFLATVAILCRQNALFIPLAYGLTFLVKHGLKPRYIFRAILPTTIGLGALLGFQYWLEVTGKTPADYGQAIIWLWEKIKNGKHLLSSFIKNSFIALMYLGLFLLPILVLLLSLKEKLKKSVLITRIVFLLSILLTTIGVFYIGKLMPIGLNVLDAAGIGPFMFHDTYTLNLPHKPEFPKWFWITVTIISIGGCASILTCMNSRIIFLLSDIKLLRQDNDRIATIFFLSGAFIYFFPISILGFYDRYLITLVGLISLILVSLKNKFNLPNSKFKKAAAILSLVIFAFFSVSTTHDYLSWNRTRWMALQSLIEIDNISPSQIDGGFEFNGFYLYSPTYQKRKSKNWWWVIDDAYIVTFGEVKGYEVFRKYKYTRWMPPHKDNNIFILKRLVE